MKNHGSRPPSESRFKKRKQTTIPRFRQKSQFMAYENTPHSPHLILSQDIVQ